MGVAMTIQGSLICPVTGTLFMELPELLISNSEYLQYIKRSELMHKAYLTANKTNLVTSECEIREIHNVLQAKLCHIMLDYLNGQSEIMDVSEVKQFTLRIAVISE